MNKPHIRLHYTPRPYIMGGAALWSATVSPSRDAVPTGATGTYTHASTALCAVTRFTPYDPRRILS